jgi:UDP-N-acetylmuramoyl-L-alanyl-D-glutamate--2,6-diaminopimelate ligase
MISDRPGSVLPTIVVPDPRAILGPLAAVLHGRPSEQMDVVGITGTNGKTTTAFLTQYLLDQAGSRAGRVTTIDMAWDGEVRPSVRTTPEAPDLQAALARMVKAGCRAAVIEVSSHGLALARVDGTRFAVGVFTNLGHDHYDFHSDRESYLACKASLFRRERCRIGVINIDDEAGRQIARTATCPVVTVSSLGSPDADWRVTAVDYGPDSTAVEVSGEVGSFEAIVPMAGRHNLDNALAAFAACHQLGIDVTTVADHLVGFPGVRGRLERLDAGQPFDAFVDFAHNPEGLMAVLAAARMRTRTRGDGRVIVVFGAPGDRDRSKRPLMREAAVAGADVAIVTTDDPYFEDPGAIIADVMRGEHEDGKGATVLVEPDRVLAIARAVDMAEEGDVVLVTGRGHETVQNLKGEEIPFDDREELWQALYVATAAGPTVGKLA